MQAPPRGTSTDGNVPTATSRVRLHQYADGRMDPRNAAAYLGYSYRTLANWRGQGTGPRYVAIHGRIFYYREDLDAWLARFKRVTSTAQAHITLLEKD